MQADETVLIAESAVSLQVILIAFHCYTECKCTKHSTKTIVFRNGKGVEDEFLQVIENG